MVKNFLPGVLFLGSIFSLSASAGPADYVYTPTMEFGEREIDFKHGSARQQDGTLKQVTSMGFGYGAKEYWFTEVYIKQERSGSGVANLAEWENKFQLTDTGEYQVDVGLITELEAPLSSNAPWEFKFGPLFQSDFGKFQLNGNLLFERAFGKADESGVPYTTNIGYQLQVKYRWQPRLEFGLQSFGEMGKWNDWDKQTDQNHRIGPAIFGKFPLGNRQAVKYNAAWLFGSSNAAPDHTFRMQVEYEF
ncbi:MAG: hypothetical protein ACOY9D_04095 [Pseudomonadota bacterium]